MHTIRLPSIHVLVVTTRCQYSGGGRWLGPQVNKFEQVSSDYHQSSVVGEGRDRYQVWCQGKRGGGVGPWYDLQEGIPYHMTLGFRVTAMHIFTGLILYGKKYNKMQL